MNLNWVLIAIIGILAVYTMWGSYRGIIKMIFPIVSLIGTLIAVFILLPVVSGVIKDNTKIYGNLEQIVGEQILPENEFTGFNQEEIIDSLGLPEVIKDVILENNTAEKYIELGVSSLREYMVRTVTDMIFNMAAFLIAFLIVFILLRIIFGFMSMLASLPVIHGVNKLAGAAAGFVMGLAVVWIIFAILTVFGSSQLSRDVLEKINGNELLTFIYNNNFIMKYVQIIMR